MVPHFKQGNLSAQTFVAVLTRGIHETHAIIAIAARTVFSSPLS